LHRLGWLRCRARGLALLVCLTLALGRCCQAMEVVQFKHQGTEKTVSGKLVVEAEDGGLLLLSPDTALWAVEPQDLVRRTTDDTPYAPLVREELARQLTAELKGFRVHHTEHYLICYNTSRGYAEWCGALYERLYAAFYDYWRDRGMKLSDPPAPLVALVFHDRATYAEYAKSELGEATDSIIGYYSLRTNRVMMYDLTGVEGANLGDRAGMATRVNAILARPQGQRTVATIIHEATHQLAFNSGMKQRLADIPLWLSEGMAVYFETPDLSTARGWRKVGAVNQLRLLTFRKYLAARPVDSLATLVTGDERFRDGKSAAEAYAEAWALNYFLIRTRPKQYVAYLETLSKKGPLLSDSPAERLAEFQAAFGEDLQKLDAAFVKYMNGVR
jgi:hypothetical protein